MKTLKRTFLILTMAFSLSVLPTQKAEPAIAGATTGWVSTVAYVYAGLSGAAVLYSLPGILTGDGGDGFVELMVFFGGLLFLDDASYPEFVEINSDIALEAGLSKNELLKWNSNLEESNQVARAATDILYEEAELLDEAQSEARLEEILSENLDEDLFQAFQKLRKYNALLAEQAL